MSFRYFAVGFAAALVIFYHLSELPSSFALMFFSLLWLLAGLKLHFILAKIPSGLSFLPSSVVHDAFIRLIPILFGLIIGFNYAYWQAFFTPKLPLAAFNDTVLVKAQVSGLPVWKENRSRSGKKYHLQLLVEEVYLPQSGFKKQTYAWKRPKLSVNWYLQERMMPENFDLSSWPVSGKKYWFSVKLKPPIGQFNPGGFDYETYLFANRIQARGYLKTLKLDDSDTGLFFKTTGHEPKKSAVYEIVDSSSLLLENLQLFRWQLQEHLNRLWQDSQFHSVYLALILGERSQLDNRDWQLFQHTGTIHLMAISGLHIGIAAFFGYWLFWGLWKLLVFRLTVVNLMFFSAIGGFLTASLYASVSGFSIATERAWIMVVVGLAFLVWMRKFQLWSAYFMALFLVLIWDTTAVLSIGFWLSFTAVALIFAVLPGIQGRSRWQQFLILQLVLSLGLMPILIWAFGMVPLYGLISNLIALPLVTLWILPLLFVTVLCSFVSIEFAQWLLMALDYSMKALWMYLQWIMSLPNGVLYVPKQPGLWLIGIYGLIFWGLFHWSSRRSLSLLLLEGKSKQEFAHYLRNLSYEQQMGKNSSGYLKIVLWGILSLIVMVAFLRIPQTPQQGTFRLTVLDVGQGQAAVIETANHTLVYDSGADWGPTMDGAKLAVIPYLRYQGIDKIDTLMISHSDSDHAGGTQSLLETFSLDSLFTGQSEIMNRRFQARAPFQQCLKGQNWTWDGVRFEVFGPFRQWLETLRLSDNDSSCLLKISAGDQSVMLVGDLSTSAEKRILKTIGSKSHEFHLKTKLLLAGHHGSRSSTGVAWLEMLQPEYALISAGRFNRFGFPHKEVIRRLEQRQIKWWNTACSGAISVDVSDKGVKLVNQSRISQSKWYYQPCSEKL